LRLQRNIQGGTSADSPPSNYFEYNQDVPKIVFLILSENDYKGSHILIPASK
jgi:hypothetical protein